VCVACVTGDCTQGGDNGSGQNIAVAAADTAAVNTAAVPTAASKSDHLSVSDALACISSCVCVCKKSALLCAVKCHIDVSFTSRLANSVGCRYIYDRANIYHVSLAKNLGLQHGGTIKAGTG